MQVGREEGERRDFLFPRQQSNHYGMKGLCSLTLEILGSDSSKGLLDFPGQRPTLAAAEAKAKVAQTRLPRCAPLLFFRACCFGGLGVFAFFTSASGLCILSRKQPQFDFGVTSIILMPSSLHQGTRDRKSLSSCSCLIFSLGFLSPCSWTYFY